MSLFVWATFGLKNFSQRPLKSSPIWSHWMRANWYKGERGLHDHPFNGAIFYNMSLASCKTVIYWRNKSPKKKKVHQEFGNTHRPYRTRGCKLEDESWTNDNNKLESIEIKINYHSFLYRGIFAKTYLDASIEGTLIARWLLVERKVTTEYC